MKLQEMKKLAETLTTRDMAFVQRAKEGKRYFKAENDILKKGLLRDRTGLRVADNRVTTNFLFILTTSKASYLATNEIIIDTGDEALNKIVMDDLGEKWQQTIYELIIFAAIAGCAYIHYWIDDSGKFQYAPVEAEHIMPLETNDLIKKLEGIVYQHRVIVEGEMKTEVDYYNDASVFFYISDSVEDDWYDSLEEYYPWLDYKQSLPDTPNEMRHGMGDIPFIKFKNNFFETNDLKPIKELIDAYDKVLSGFVNDLEDLQEVFMVLKGYEGTDLDEFKEFLRKYKIVPLESDDEIKGDLEIESIQIPYEARSQLLDLLRKRIFEDGQGIDPDPQNFGNSSGTALKHLYDNLELKSAQVEMYFRPGIEALVRAICKYHGREPKYVNQTWTRNIPTDDAEMATVVRTLDGILPIRTQLELLPFIDDVDKVLAELEKEEEKEELNDGYGNFGLLGGTVQSTGGVNSRTQPALDQGDSQTVSES